MKNMLHKVKCVICLFRCAGWRIELHHRRPFRGKIITNNDYLGQSWSLISDWLRTQHHRERNSTWISFCTISKEILYLRFARFLFYVNHDILHAHLQVAKKFMGYLIAIVIGLLFVIFMPLGLCFCCCRLRGNCGGFLLNVQIL